MIILENGAPELSQYETRRYAITTTMCTHMTFWRAGGAGATMPVIETDNGYKARIPDNLIANYGYIEASATISDGNGSADVVDTGRFYVRENAIPENYAPDDYESPVYQGLYALIRSMQSRMDAGEFIGATGPVGPQGDPAPADLVVPAVNAYIAEYLRLHPEATIDEDIIRSAVNAWLANHPEYVTTVMDNSISAAKLTAAVRENVEAVPGLKRDLWDIREAIYTTQTASYSAAYIDKALNIDGWTNVLTGWNTSSAIVIPNGMTAISFDHDITYDAERTNQMAIMWFTSASLGTGIVGYERSVSAGSLIPIPSGAAYVRFSYMSGTNVVAKFSAKSDLKKITLVSASLDSNNKASFVNSEGEEAFSLDLSKIKITEDNATFFIASANLFDKSAITPGTYWNNTGAVSGRNEKYFLSDYIPVTPGQTIRFAYQSRFVTAFDSSKNTLTDKGADYVQVFTVQSGVAYIRFTGFTANITAVDYMVNAGDNLLPYEPFGAKKFDPAYMSDYLSADAIKVVESLSGGNSASITADSVAPSSQISIAAFPQNLKKGLALSFFAKFSDFSSVIIGMGYNAYRGVGLRITNQNVDWVRYDDSSTAVYNESKAHGLTMNTFVAVSMYVDNDSVCHYTITTKTGSYGGSYSWRYELNGAPFAVGGQTMTSVKLSAVATDIKSPIWLFGDSYFGFANNRVLGWLKNYGYADGCLIVGLAGLNSTNAYSNNLEKLIALGGMPKYLVWCEGMNDYGTVYADILAKLKALQEKYGFELILYKTPTVASRASYNNANNTAMLNSGYRYIDAFAAVGTNTSGNWYDGYLSSDGVHPTADGAMAIASRFLVDVPELMQYGYKVGNITGGITGDR